MNRYNAAVKQLEYMFKNTINNNDVENYELIDFAKDVSEGDVKAAFYDANYEQEQIEDGFKVENELLDYVVSRKFDTSAEIFEELKSEKYKTLLLKKQPKQTTRI
jgi:hypothetical protein